MRTWIAIVAFCLAGASSARATDGTIATGTIVDRVVCSSDPSKSYALYVPSTYRADRKWPILYCFDPDARGREPLTRFAAAAERFGWIVAGSWDSRNGKIEDSIAAGAAMWADTHARFAIDDRRIYTTGFSGGARVATFSALSCGTCIAGVIACGAGFPQGTQPGDARLPQPVSFVYFGTVGTDDFNFPEMKTLDGLLAKSHVQHEIVHWDGTHDWAPEAVATRAVGWMEAQAMRAGLRTTDATLLGALYDERLADARSLEAAGRPYEAWLAYAGATNEFAGLRDVAEAERKSASLGASKEVRTAESREADELKRQARLVGETASIANTRGDQEDPLAATHDFQSRIASIRKTARETEDSSERRVARRSLHQIFAYYYEGAMNLSAQKKYDQAAKMLEVAVLIVPKAGGVYYDLAANRARLGDRKRALSALASAVESGFSDAGRLRSDPAFEPLRSIPEFTKLVESIKPPAPQ